MSNEMNPTNAPSPASERDDTAGVLDPANVLDRRRALLTLGLAAVGGATWANAAWADTRRLRLAEAATPAVPGAAPAVGHADIDATVEARLRADLERLAPKVYSEEGIPMFLGGDDLVAGAPAHVELTAYNAALSASMRRNAAAYLHLHPDAKLTDISKLIEVLADRDFATGGRGDNL